MSKERLIELAKQAGWEYAHDDRGFEPLWAFAELVRADERALAAPVQESVESWEDLRNALQRIDTAAVGLPTFEIRHEGGLDAVVQNIVDAIVSLHEDRTTPPNVATPPAAQRQWVGLEQTDMPDGADPMFDHPYFINGMVYAANLLMEKNT